MYLKHFGLTELPFGITPDTSFTYLVQYHQEALNTLLLALNEGIAPPTIGLEQEDDVCRLNYVKGTAQKLESDYALSNSFGFGGHNSCLVLKRGR